MPLYGITLLGSLGYWDKIERDLPVPNYLFILINVRNVQSHLCFGGTNMLDVADVQVTITSIPYNRY